MESAAPRRKRGVPPDSELPLEVHVERTRQRLRSQAADALPGLREEAARLEREVATMIERWQVRPRRDAERRLADAREELRRLESGHYVQEHERLLLPYAMARSGGPAAPAAATAKRARPRTGPPARAAAAGASAAAAPAGSIDAFVARDEPGRPGDSAVIAEYLAEVHGAPPRLRMDARDTCVDCGCKMLLLCTKSLMACPSCGGASTYLDATSSSVSYGDEVEFTSFSYKRLNHFNEWMAQVQAKESFDIDESIVRSVMRVLYERRVRLQDVTQTAVREVLRTMRLRRTYEHVAQITMRITGQPPPRMTPDREELCRLLFIAVQPAFDKHCPANRSNFLSYSRVPRPSAPPLERPARTSRVRRPPARRALGIAHRPHRLPSLAGMFYSSSSSYSVTTSSWAPSPCSKARTSSPRKTTSSRRSVPISTGSLSRRSKRSGGCRRNSGLQRGPPRGGIGRVGRGCGSATSSGIHRSAHQRKQQPSPQRGPRVPCSKRPHGVGKIGHHAGRGRTSSCGPGWQHGPTRRLHTNI